MKLYPINELVREHLAQSRLTPREFLARLGYRNFNKGKRHLDAVVVHNSVAKAHPAFRDKVFQTFAVAPERIAEARAATRAILLEQARVAATEKDRARKKIRFEAVFEKKPSGFHGHMYQYGLSKIAEYDAEKPETLIPVIGDLIRQRQQASPGDMSPCGATVAYRLCVTSFERWIFNPDGNLDRKQIDPPLLGPRVDF